MFGCLIISETIRDRRTEDLLCRDVPYLGIQTFQREHCQFTLACHHGWTHPLRTECEGGMDERCVTNGGNAIAGLVLGRSRWKTGMAHYGLAVAARFLCLLSLRRQRK